MAENLTVTGAQPHAPIVRRALRYLEARLRWPGEALSSNRTAQLYAQLRLSGLEHEVFLALWLNADCRVVRCDELFRGTLTSTPVYPREVVKAALQVNAAFVIFAHNHPSGNTRVSEGDKLLTGQLSDALRLVDVRVLDHIIVAGKEAVSMATQGLL